MLKGVLRHRRRLQVLSLAGLLVAGLVASGRAVPGSSATVPPSVTTVGQDSGPARPDAEANDDQGPSFTIVAKKYQFTPARIQVRQDDLVKITFVAEDIPHSFTLDALRIAKRASPGHPAVFEFRAELPDGSGDVTYPFYCNLTIDDGCRRMRGELVIERKQ